MPPLRVFLPVTGAAQRIAGVPAVVRTVHALKKLSPETVLMWGKARHLLRPWRAQMRGVKLIVAEDGVPPAEFVAGRTRLLSVSSEGFADAEGLLDFERHARGSDQPVRWIHRGRTVAAYHPAGSDWQRCQPGSLLDPPVSAAFETAESHWLPAGSEDEIRRAEKALFDRLPQDSDGFIAQFDRKLSIPISKLLLGTPVTPNQITTVSLVLGLLGAWMLATAVYSWQVLGALILWSCVIFDGCDGEVARLKLLATPSGGRYDVIVDNIVHVAIFFGIAVAMHREDPTANLWIPMAILLTGFFACAYTIWWLVLRHPKEGRDQAQILVDKLSGRDFIYIILLLALVGKLEWFLWAAAIGAHVVNLAFWWVCRDRKS